MRKTPYILILLATAIIAFLSGGFLMSRMSKDLLDEFNSFAGSNFDFANYEFFRNLERKEILLYTFGEAQQSNAGEYAVVVIPISKEPSNYNGLANQISHRNGAAITFASNELLNGDKLVGYSLFKILLKICPDEYLTGTVAEGNKLSEYFPHIEKCYRGEAYDNSLLEEEASQYQWRRKAFSLTNGNLL